jgi:hypothetical protein
VLDEEKSDRAPPREEVSLRLDVERLTFRWHLAALLLAAAAGCAASPLYWGKGDGAILLVFGASVPLYGLYVLRVRNLGMARQPVELEVGARTLRLTPGPEVSRDTIVKGSYSQTDDGYWVKLERRALRRTLWLFVVGREDARRVLDALRLGPADATFSTRVGSRLAGSGAWSYGALSIALPSLAWLATIPFIDDRELLPIALGAAGSVTVICWVLVLIPTRFDVDARGVALTWLFRGRTIAFDEVAAVEHVVRSLGQGNFLHSITLHLVGDTKVRLTCGHSSFGGQERASTVHLRLEDAFRGAMQLPLRPVGKAGGG